jgi:FAD/FMN-containing dehydrogenase
MLDQDRIAKLKLRLRGQLIGPHDESYDRTRGVWNGMIDRRPSLIVRCTGAADVIDAVNFARENGLAVAVRGGGHNVGGLAVCDGNLMIDLSPMTGVRVDTRARLVQVQGGGTWGDVDRETQAFGLATPGGLVSTTGVAGLTLCGGIGYLRRKHGLSCDNLQAVDIVTADGQFLTASEEENPDLFWAVRGGGGNFGVATSFTFRLHPVGPEVMFVAAMYPAEQGIPVTRRWREHMASAPEEISSQAMFWSVPDAPGFPAEARGKPVLVVIALCTQSVRQAEALLQPLRSFGTPLVDMSGPAPYREVQRSFDWLFPKGELLHYWKCLYLRELSDEVLEAVSALGRARPSNRTFVNLWHMGGAMSRIPPEATAFGDRSAPFLLEISSTWSQREESERNVAWTRQSWEEMRRYSTGRIYLNWAGLGEEGESLVRAAYGPNYKRLTDIKRRHDPSNMFRFNQNIRPDSEL